jgi:signal transduction histidine kinase
MRRGREGAAPARIFEPYEQAVCAHKLGGFGVGLCLAHKIVSALGGTLRLESQPGRGATCTVDLPVSGPGSASSGVSAA